MNTKVRVAAICLAILVMAGLVLLVVRPSLNPAQMKPLPLIATAWMAFLAAAWLLRKVPLRAAIGLIVLGGIAVQLTAVAVPPKNSDDLYRYIWDGRVQAAGIDPYEYAPAARQLTGLRNEFLWNPHATYCITQSTMASNPGADLAPGCTMINRPVVPTIYPPVAEAYFLGVHYLPGGSDSSMPIQATTALVAVLTTVLLMFGLGRLGRDPRMAALWSWCPTVALEAGNSAHVDVVAVAITAAALLTLATARTTRRTVLGGILLGLAVATKLIPALTVPAVLRRRWITVSLAAGGAFVTVYIPHVLAVGSKVIGFMPGYLKEDGYTSGTRFGIIGLVLGGRAAIAAVALVLAVVALLVLRFSDPDQPWRGAVVMTAAALAVTTPSFQWYSLLLVMLVALDGRPEWLAFAAGGYYAAEPNMGNLTVPNRYHDAVAYGVPVLVVAAGWLVRRELARRRGAASTEPIAITADTAVQADTAVAAEAAVAAGTAVTAASAVDGGSTVEAGTGAGRLTTAGTRVDGVPV
ncbi:MAG: glycosyltransferase 87 family protein [Streptosporangiaceae bacterium]